MRIVRKILVDKIFVRKIFLIKKIPIVFSLAIIYASFTLLNIAAATIVGILGTRWALLFGACTYALFQAGFLFLNRFYLFGSSALLGLGAAGK